MQRFCNRTEAGRILAQKLSPYANRHDLIVLPLSRNGLLQRRKAPKFEGTGKHFSLPTLPLGGTHLFSETA